MAPASSQMAELMVIWPTLSIQQPFTKEMICIRMPNLSRITLKVIGEENGVCQSQAVELTPGSGFTMINGSDGAITGDMDGATWSLDAELD